MNTYRLQPIIKMDSACDGVIVVELYIWGHTHTRDSKFPFFTRHVETLHMHVSA